MGGYLESGWTFRLFHLDWARAPFLLNFSLLSLISYFPALTLSFLGGRQTYGFPTYKYNNKYKYKHKHKHAHYMPTYLPTTT